MYNESLIGETKVVSYTIIQVVVECGWCEYQQGGYALQLRQLLSHDTSQLVQRDILAHS